MRRIKEMENNEFFYYFKHIAEDSNSNEEIGQKLKKSLIFAISELNSIEKMNLDANKIFNELKF